MCGIAGIWFKERDDQLRSKLQAMTDSIAHRGPDGEGHWLSSEFNIGFGHRRLSIIDLSESAAQPMQFEDLVITYNGEIYNYVEIKKELESIGVVFSTQSDTEVLIAGYKTWGKAFLQKLDGMFAFAIYDKSTKELFCARDRFGEKPFYFINDNQRFAFASEMKALFAIGVERSVDSEMMFYYLAYDVVENPHDKQQTFYKNIKSLPAAHYLHIDQYGNQNITQYWDLDVSNQSLLSLDDATDRFRELLDISVTRRMRSDVKVGSSLSGGIDSSSILGTILTLFPESHFSTFTARFNDENYDEGKFIEILHRSFEFKSYNCFPHFDQIINELDKVFYHQEEPFGSTSIIAQWEVMKLAKQHDTIVLLDGQGADETLGGYFKYFLPYLYEMRKTSRSKMNNELMLIEENLGLSDIVSKGDRLRMKAPSLYDKIGKATRKFRGTGLGDNLNDEFSRNHIHAESPFLRKTTLNSFLHDEIFAYGLGKLLRFSDRNAMAHSREVRLPYLSHEMVEFVFSLPSEYKMGNGWNKYLLRKSMEQRIPKEICYRKDKKGFQAPKDWLSKGQVNELAEDSRQLLISEKYIDADSKLNNWQSIMAAKVLG